MKWSSSSQRAKALSTSARCTGSSLKARLRKKTGSSSSRLTFLKNKWLPTTKQEAHNWFMTSPNAAGVRAKGRNVRIYRLQNRLWEDTARERTEKKSLRTGLPPKFTTCPRTWTWSQTTLEWSQTGTQSSASHPRGSRLLPLFTVLSQFSAITTSMMSPADVLQLAGDRIIRHDMAYEIGTGDPVFGEPVDRRLGVYEATNCARHVATLATSTGPTSAQDTLAVSPLESPVPNWLYLSGHPTLSSHSLPQAHLRLLQPHHSTLPTSLTAW